MNNKNMFFLAVKSILFMLGTIFLCIAINPLEEYALSIVQKDYEVAAEEMMTEQYTQVSMNEDMNQMYTEIETDAEKEEIRNAFIQIKKKESSHQEVLIADMYMIQSIQVMLTDTQENEYSEDSIVNIEALKSKVKKVDFSYIWNPVSSSYTTIMEMQMDSVYAYRMYEDDDYIYIEMCTPHDIFDKVLVIDAGHGGDDTGTCSGDGIYEEKNINLQVVLYLKEILEKEYAEQSTKIYYTRLTRDYVDLDTRVRLANAVEADLFLSVHCNGSEEESPQGTEIIYKTDEISKKTAEIFQKRVTDALGTKMRGMLNGESIYILKHAKNPAVLIELGFMTNDEDMSILKEAENQEKAAVALYESIEQYWEDCYMDVHNSNE